MMHLFVAYNHDAVWHWCKENGVNPHTIRYLGLPKDARGLGDYNIVFLDRWYNSQTHSREMIDRLLRDAENIIYTSLSEPVVHEGRIISWRVPEKNFT